MAENADDEDDPFFHYKLCGFLRAILSVASPPDEALAPGAACSLFYDGPNVGFRSDSGTLLLLPIQTEETKGEGPVQEDQQFLNSLSASSKKRGRKRGMVLVKGSASVVHQLAALVSNKCIKIGARVFKVSVGDGGKGLRAVVLVDVYLPIDAWSGWQFPRSGPLAASLFKHLSCNWQVRSSLLAVDSKAEDSPHIDNQSIWSSSDCHVLGCQMHCNAFGSGNGSFDLHEIFKSVPTASKEERLQFTRIQPLDASIISGIWNVADDVMTKVLTLLGPKDLLKVAATCRHMRSLAVSITPCMKLKLFPHQEAAIEWMIKREHNANVLPHPLYLSFSTDDGFSLYINAVSGKISTGMAPMINDFRGGMFCDEPGLGKTITTLSLILKTHGTLADPPHGVDVIWCMYDGDRRCGYYELSADNFTPANFMSTWKRFMGQNLRRGEVSPSPSLELCSTETSKSPSCKRGRSTDTSKSPSRKRSRSLVSEMSSGSASFSNGKSGNSSCRSAHSMQVTNIPRCKRSMSNVKRDLLDTFGRASGCEGERKAVKNAVSRACNVNAPILEPQTKKDTISPRFHSNYKKSSKNTDGSSSSNETWVQCDACRKWRKLYEITMFDVSAAWFCSMNNDPKHQTCEALEEYWDHKRKITFLPGFYTKGTVPGKEQNVSFFINVLKEHCTLLDSETKKALAWLANISGNKVLDMETVGLRRPTVLHAELSEKDAHGYCKIFQAFGLVRRVEKGTSRWYYPCNLENLAFDLTALRIALTKPLNLFRLYLSNATLIVVPANLVDHWKTQIQKHVNPGQLRVFVWTDHKKPSAHILAWNYDIVIITFNRLSAEWGSRKRSILMQVHWRRIMLDEGHTLGCSLSLTNKLQMAISLAASSRWILTGTPTPNTPNSQVAHLQPMLKFLHEETYGQNQEIWEAGILRPFEAMLEEGRSRLLLLLRRIMTSARKTDLRNIPPCIKKNTLLHFTEEHARSYNELVVTVRRNILMADWNDPSHVESLLNPKQWKFRSNTIRNVRLSCCVAGHIKVTDAGEDIQETMDLLVQEGLDQFSEEYVFIKISLLDGCSCSRCKTWCRLPIVTPCRHLLCLDCVALDSEKCTYPGCGNPYEMQSPEILTRPENPNPKWPVPKDLIELQPSYKQDDWDPDWQSTTSSKVAYLVKKLKELLECNRKIGYCIEGSDNSEILVYSEREYQDLTTLPNDQSCKNLPEKVIIFSQFLEHIHVIEQQLTIAGIRYAGMYSPMHSGNKMKSLMVFQHDVNCMVLLMDGSAALGLDLSFVTHVFLMEPIWDRSMEEQVISRAHRMGATRPIHVETLAMRGTIEEQMLVFLQDVNTSRQALNQEFTNKFDEERARTRRTLHDFAESNYLAQLSFVRTNA